MDELKDQLKFIDTLDEEQRINLNRVIDSAIKNGVNPRLAAALAFTESQLRQSQDGKVVRGGAGEIGIMQIKPSTGKLMGYELKTLMDDPQANIDAGMKYLRQSIDKFGDPMLGVVGYNAGPDHPFFQGKGDPPAQSVDYVNRIRSYGGFAEPEPEVQPAEAPAEQAPQELTMKEEVEKRVPGIMGAGAGAATGTTIEAGKRLASAKDLVREFMESRIAEGRAPSGVGLSPSGGAPGLLPPPGGPLSNQPAGGRMTQNWIRAQDTAGRYADVGQQARSMAEAHRMKEAAIAAEDKIRQIAPEMRQAPNRAGLFIPEQIGSGPRGARTVPIETPPTYSLLDDATQKLGNIARGGLKIASAAPVAGALGGYGAAMSGVEAYEREKAGDRPGAIISGLGGLQALAAIPHPVTQGIGLTAGIASPLGLMVLDRMRKIRAEPPVAPATAAELQEAAKPAFRYARP